MRRFRGVSGFIFEVLANILVSYRVERVRNFFLIFPFKGEVLIVLQCCHAFFLLQLLQGHVSDYQNLP